MSRVVSKTADGLAPQLPNETTTTKYLRQDGSWSVPPDNNTTTGTSYNAGSCPDNTTFATNGSVSRAYNALNDTLSKFEFNSVKKVGFWTNNNRMDIWLYVSNTTIYRIVFLSSAFIFQKSTDGGYSFNDIRRL